MEMAVKKKMQDVREQWPGRKGKKSIELCCSFAAFVHHSCFLESYNYVYQINEVISSFGCSDELYNSGSNILSIEHQYLHCISLHHISDIWITKV